MLAMKKVRREFEFRLSEVVRLRYFWNFQLRRLNEHELIDLAGQIYIRSSKDSEKGLMLDVRSALSRKDKQELAEILQAWRELQSKP